MHRGPLRMPRAFEVTTVSSDRKLFKLHLHVYCFWQNKNEKGDTEEKAALLINTKLQVYVKCQWAVFEYTQFAYINFQSSAGHCFVLIITSMYTFPSTAERNDN